MSASLTTADLPLPSLNQARSTWWTRPAVISVALALAVLLPYLRVWNQQFINFDDNLFITRNPFVRSGLTLQSIAWAFTIHGPSQWHPLAWLSHMLDVQLFGPWAGGHKLHNVILHVANVVLLFHVLRLMTRRLGPSVVVAAIFGLHPQRVEAIAWAAERKEVLSAFFGLWTLLAYWWYTQSPSARRYASVVLLFVLTLMAKPVLVTMPCILLLLDYWPLNRLNSLRTSEDWRRFRALAVEKLPLFLPVVLSSYLTLLCQKDADTFSDWSLWPLSSRIGNAAIGYAWYIKSTFAPANLSIIYPLHKELSSATVAAAIAILVVVTWLVLRAATQRKYLFFGWFFFLGTLVPAIGIIQVGPQRYADRYSYISSIGLLIATVWGCCELIKRWHIRPRVVGVSLGAALLALTLCTFRQLGYWQESITLFAHSVNVEERNPPALNNLGTTYLEYNAPDQAMACFREILTFDPGNVMAIGNVGNCYMTEHRFADAATWFRLGIRTDPSFALNYGNLGAVLLRMDETTLAIRALRHGIELLPNQHDVHESLGVALERQGDFDGAVREFQTAVRLSPDTALTRVFLALELLKVGRLDEALVQADCAVKLDPHEAAAVAPVREAQTAARQSPTASVPPTN